MDNQPNPIVDRNAPILITGANGFIGSNVVETLLLAGFSNLRCLVRSSNNSVNLDKIIASAGSQKARVLQGNLLSRDDCFRASKDVAIIFHLAAGFEKTFAGCFLNSVVTTRNLLDAATQSGCLRRFVNVSSFSVYSNRQLSSGELLDETCDVEQRPLERSEPYMYAKLKQDQLVMEYAHEHGIQFVIVRPGAVYGPGAKQITARVGIDTFGLFFHLGGSNKLPLTYVDNCAQAIVAAGTHPGSDGHTFNVVDDDLPTSRQFLRMYKRNASHFRSLFIPYWMFYGFCWMWESYSTWSKGQLPPVFNRRRCETYWKGNSYSNEKLARIIGWRPAVPFSEASKRYFESIRSGA